MSETSAVENLQTELASDIARMDNLTREASPQQGLVFCSEFIHKHPGRGEGFFYAGLLNYQMGLLGQAMEMMTEAHNLDPDVREFALALSSLYAKANKLNDALYFAKVGAANEPCVLLDEALPEELRDFIASTLFADPQKHYVQAMIAFNMQDFSKAVVECEQELKINSRFAPGYALIGKALLKCESFERALMAFRTVLDLNQQQPDPDLNVDEINVSQAECCLRLGAPEEALRVLADVLEKDTVSVKILSAVMGLLVYVADEEWQQVREICRTWSESLLDGKSRYFPLEPLKSERVRVGFLTDKAFQCLEGRALEVFSKRYDHRYFDCYLYTQNVIQDGVTHGFSGSMTGTRSIFDIDDKTLALIIKRDEIDVLVDMCGYGENQRLNLMAHKPARAQVSWMTSPIFEGQPGIDRYWRHDPASGAPLVVESLQGYDAVTALPASDKGTVTFGARLDLSYITPQIAAMWGDLLLRVEGSQLSLGLVEDVSQAMVDQLRTLFEPTGLLERISLHTAEEGREDRGSFFKEIDIVLAQPTVDAVGDFIDALWCGVPCLSVPTDRRACYTGRDIVAHAGDPGWNATDAEDFVKQGALLASDLEVLASHRSQLRGRMENSLLFDGDAFADQLQGRLIEVVNWSRQTQEVGT